MVSSSHIVYAIPSSSGRRLLTLFPCSAWDPSHGRQASTNFFSMSPSHSLQFFTNCSSVGPSHGVQFLSPVGSQVLPANLLQCGLLFLHGSTGPVRSLLQRRLPMGSQPPPGTHLLWGQVVHGLQVDICSTIDLHGLQGGQPALPWSSPRAAGESLL